MTITSRSPRVARGRTRSPSPPAPAPRFEAVPVFDEVYRVQDSSSTVGYVERVGVVFVVLAGPVYNTSIEVAQCLDLEQAIEHLRPT